MHRYTALERTRLDLSARIAEMWATMAEVADRPAAAARLSDLYAELESNQAKQRALAAELGWGLERRRLIECSRNYADEQARWWAAAADAWAPDVAS